MEFSARGDQRVKSVNKKLDVPNLPKMEIKGILGIFQPSTRIKVEQTRKRVKTLFAIMRPVKAQPRLSLTTESLLYNFLIYMVNLIKF